MAGCWSSSSIETVNKKRFRAKCSSSLLTLSPAQRLTTQIRWTSILRRSTERHSSIVRIEL
jgi:hypothetical protein